MGSLYKSWVVQNKETGLCSLSLRWRDSWAEDGAPPRLALNLTALPPTELFQGRKLDIESAKMLGVMQDHAILGTFDVEDLVEIRRAIGHWLGSPD